MYLFKIYLIIILGNIYIWDIGKEAVETASLQAGLCCLVYLSHGAGGDQRPWATCSILCKILKPQEEPSLKLWNLGLWHQMTTCSYLIAWFFSNLCLHSNWLIGVSDSIWGQEWLRVYFFVTLYFFVADKVWKYLNLCSLLSGLTVKKEKKQSDWLYILLAVYLSVKYYQSAHVKLDWCCYVFHFHMCSNDSMLICFSKRNRSAYIADF